MFVQLKKNLILIILIFFSFGLLSAQTTPQFDLLGISQEQLESLQNNEEAPAFNNNSGEDTSLDNSEVIQENLVTTKFGFDFITSIPTSISASSDLPVPSEYVISPNDELKILLTGNKKTLYDLQIGMDGSLLIPEVGSIQVAGKTFEEVKKLIQDLISLSYVGTKVNVTLGALKSKKINIIGAVKQPGTYLVNPFSSLTNVLAYSGGLESYASLRNITLIRKDEKIFFDLYDLLVYGDRTKDVNIQQGDTVLVPGTDNFVSIQGSVLRPKIYEYKSDDNISDLIDFSLGFKQNADSDNLTAVINSSQNQIRKKINLEEKVGKTKLINLYINKLALRQDEGIQVKGSSVSEKSVPSGVYSNLSDLINDLEFSSDIYPFYAKISQDSLGGLVKENFSFSISDPNTYKEIELKQNVVINFFSRGEIDKYQEYFLQTLLKDLSSQDEVSSSPIEEVNMMPDQNSELVTDFTENFNQDIERNDLEILQVEQLVSPTVNINLNYLKAVYFGSEEYIMPITGNISPNLLLNFMGKELSIIQDGVTVTTSNGLVENSLMQNFSSREVFEINFPEQESSKFEVEIIGQVQNPGKYIVNSQLSLDDLYKIAGGLNDRSDRNAVILSRESIKESEIKAIDASRKVLLDTVLSQLGNPMNSSSNLDLGPLLSVIEMSKDINFVGRLTGDLKPGSDTAINLYLEPGDLIIVPPKKNVVYISGEVLQPTATTFKPNLTAIEYINIAGGLTEYADKSKVFIIKADGTSVPAQSNYFERNIYLEPGDTVVIPRDLDKLNTLPLISTATQVISNIAFAAASLNSISR